MQQRADQMVEPSQELQQRLQEMVETAQDSDGSVSVSVSSTGALQDFISNTHKVLLTRGMTGVCVHSPDPETQEFLERVAA